MFYFQIESTLVILTNVIEEIKNSLEKMCKVRLTYFVYFHIYRKTNTASDVFYLLNYFCTLQDLKCSHLDLSMKKEVDDVAAYNIKSNVLITTDETALDYFSGVQPIRPPHTLSLYDTTTDKNRLMSAGNDLKFVLYMYEVRKMRDIYGRISAALEVIRDKKYTFINIPCD